MAAPKPSELVRKFRQELLDVIGRYPEVPRAEKALYLARLLCAEVGGKLGGLPTREEFLRVCGHAYDLVLGPEKLVKAEPVVIPVTLPHPFIPAAPIPVQWRGVFRWM